MAVINPINSELESRLAAEDTELEALESQMRTSDNGDPFNPNTSATESKVPAGEPETAGETQRIDGSGKDVSAEEAEEQQAQAEVEAEHAPEQAEAKPKKVRPWSELRRTKKVNEQLEATLAEERRARQQLEERFKVIEAKVAPAQPHREPEVPEFTKDPLENLNQREERTAKQLAEIRQNMQIQQLQAEINADEMNFSHEKPDYTKARDWLINRELDRARVVFRALPEAQREQYAAAMVNQRRSILIATARQTGESVAKLAYELALGEGYTSEPAAAAAPAVKPAPEVARERVIAAKERESAARASIGGTGQAPAVRTVLRREDILNMSEAEMDKMAAANENWDSEVSDA